jgi:hypothetical protein
LLPALMFTEMLYSISPENMAIIGVIFIFYLEHMILGSGVGYTIGCVTGADRDLKRLCSMVMAF